MLDLGDPDLQWVQIARMGVDAARATSMEECADLMAQSFRQPGPFLIELMVRPAAPTSPPIDAAAGVSLVSLGQFTPTGETMRLLTRLVPGLVLLCSMLAFPRPRRPTT